MDYQQEINSFIESLESTKDTHPEYFESLKKEFLNTNIDEVPIVEESNLEKINFRKYILSNNNKKRTRNYFTISSKLNFTNLPTNTLSTTWGKALVYTPLNDHSRKFLQKGDILFCYRTGQFKDLNSALDTRGIYGIGVVASDPVKLFPNRDKHNKWGVLVSFPIQLPSHLELRNIQMHPDTIDLTPYNGNRNDALQHISDPKHYRTLLNMLYSKNREISNLIKFYFSELNLELIDLPNQYLSKYYHAPTKTKENNNNNFIQSEFVKWCLEESNYRKSYDGLVSIEILNFWNETYFDSLLFSLNTSSIEASIEQVSQIVKNPSNQDWFKYSKATSRGAPEAVLGTNNYIRFLKEFFSKPENLKKLDNPIANTQYEIKTVQSKTPKVEFLNNSFLKNLETANLKLSQNLADRFVCSLQTKPFVILTGLSGSGKTKLAEAFSLWISASNKQYCMVAVGADWTNREPLLGFPNALEVGKYVKPDTGFLDLILRAIKDTNRPYFLILDEMNMSHVERYFADFLSAMESTDRTIKLRPDTTDWDDCDVPASITLPDNLFIIGTVNIDETTYMFSPKVLDRANVIEFRVSENNMKDYLEKPNGLDMNSLRGAGSSMGESFVANTREKDIITDNLGNDLMIFFNKLQEVGAEFGYRTASEISRFIAICEDTARSEMSRDEVIDAAIMQKLLPKLHGSRNKIEKILKALGSLCLEDTSNPAFLLNDDKSDKHPVKYPLSYEKLNRMHTRVLSDGFTSFAEA